MGNASAISNTCSIAVWPLPHPLPGGVPVRCCLEPIDVRRAAAGLRRPLCCLCGPPPMVDAVEVWAEAAGVAQGDVMVEKWW